MGGSKTAYSLQLTRDQMNWLTQMQETYGLFDPDKALRVILDYIIEEVDPATVFEEVRCNRCNNTSNQD